MSINTRYRGSAALFFPAFPPGVKWLIVSTVATYLVYFFGSLIHGAPIFGYFQLVPWDVVHGEIWQLVTYLFLHSLSLPPWHIVLNMLMLWMFGAAVEETWGTNRFLKYYFVCGTGAAVCVVLANLIFPGGHPTDPVIGASGAIYGLLLAFGMLFPEQELLFMFLIPIKAKYFVMIAGAMVFLGSFNLSGPVSDLAHLGGMIVGYIYIRAQFSSRRSRLATPSFSLSAWWRDYKMQRAKKKFQVYMKKQGQDKGPWVN